MFRLFLQRKLLDASIDLIHQNVLIIIDSYKLLTK